MLSFLQYLAEAIRPEIYDKVLRDMEKLKASMMPMCFNGTKAGWRRNLESRHWIKTRRP
jgi:hypothetical protein